MMHASPFLRYCAAVALDADGTLLTSQNQVCALASAQLERLRHYAPALRASLELTQQLGSGHALSATTASNSQNNAFAPLFTKAGAVLRVIATGRNLREMLSVLQKDTPVDFVVAGSGSVCVRWPSQEEVFAHSMPNATAEWLCQQLVARQCHFFALRRPPYDHVCCAYASPLLPTHLPETLDFATRCEYIGEERVTRIASVDELVAFAAASSDGTSGGVFGSFYAIGAHAVMEQLLSELSQAAGPDAIRCVRLSSPTDARVMWVEVFPPHVSKACAVARLAAMHGVPASAVLAVGNDYNDLDMLEGAAVGVLVANAPEALKARGQFVVLEQTNDAGAVAEALKRFFPL